MKITKKVETEMADGFEAAFDYIPALDKVPSDRKRKAAEAAARIAVERIEAES